MAYYTDATITIKDFGKCEVAFTKVWRGITWAGRGKDIVVLKELYGRELPVRDCSRKLAAGYIRVKHVFRNFIRGGKD